MDRFDRTTTDRTIAGSAYADPAARQARQERMQDVTSRRGLGPGVARHEGADSPWKARNVGGAERLASTVAGGLLLAWGFRQPAVRGALASAAGAALLHRGTTGHCTVYSALGISTADDETRTYAPERERTNRSLRNRAERMGGELRERAEGGLQRTARKVKDVASNVSHDIGQNRPVRVDESITIERPVHDVFRFWRDLENLPTFMSHLEEVRKLGGGRSHWVAKGPLGTKIAWDALTTDEREDERIVWRSVEGAPVPNHGIVEFRERMGGRATEIRVNLEYHPPAGDIGAAVAKLFGEEPTQQVRDDLRNLKRTLEGSKPH